MFNVSRTSLRRALDQLADTQGNRSNKYKKRVQEIRHHISKKKGQPYKLDDSLTEVAKSILVADTGLTHQEIAAIFGVSRATLHRSINKTDIDDEKDLDKGVQKDKLNNIVRVRMILHAANTALSEVSIPNDISEEERDLLVSVASTVAQLDEQLTISLGGSRFLKSEVGKFNERVKMAIPLWKRAWETFVIKGAEGAGLSAGKATVFSVGFIAGTLYSQFSTPLGKSLAV